MGLAGLGALAGGLAGGIERGEAMTARRKALDWQTEQQDRQRRQWSDDDATKELVKQANAAFASKVNLQDLKPGQQPDPAMLADAYRARGEVFAKAGRFNEVMQNYGEALPFYTQVRNRAMDQGLAQFEVDGDAIKLAQTVYPHIYDGKDITFARAGKDGAIEFSLSDGSKAAATPDQIVGMVKRMRMDPALAAKIEFERLKANEEANAKIRVEGEKGKQDRLTKTQEAEARRSLEGLQHTNTLAQIGARTAGDLKVKQTPGAAQAEPSEITLGEGQVRVRKGLDGSYKEVAAGNAKTATSKIDWTGLTSKHYGEPKMGMLGESRMPGPDTMALSISAQEIYEANKDRPGMTPEKAIELAAKQHKAVKPGAK